MIEKFSSLIENFSEFWILCTAIETDIFEIINKTSGSINDIIRERNWDKDTIEALCNCLVAYGYLEKISYHLTEESKKYLLKDSDHYMGYFAESARMFDILSKFTKYILNGDKIDISDREWATVTKISAHIGEDLPEFLFKKLPFLKDCACSVLDLGCGRMMESIKMAEINPKLRITGIESNKEIISEVINELEQKNLTERIRIMEGDVGNFDTDYKFDVAFLNHIIHCLPHKMNVEVLRKLRRLLNNGHVIIFDDLLNDDKISPKESVKKNLLAKIFKSKIYSISELRVLLQDAGFKEIECYKYNKRRIITIGK